MEDRCAICGEIVPEGRMVCPMCEDMIRSELGDVEVEPEIIVCSGNTLRVKLDAGAYEPVRAHSTDAGLDIRAKDIQIVPAKESAIFHTGVHVQLPHGTAGVLISKSGLNIKHEITSTGLIDESYSGEIVVKLYNHGGHDYKVEAGEKISQLVIVPVLYANVEIVKDLDMEGGRGDNGFGSSGRF